MVDVLVCVKRVPDAGTEVVLTADEQAVDGRYAGFTTGDHDAAAVECAIRIAEATGGSATVVSVGTADAVDQLRGALALGCSAATLVECDPGALGPADVAHEIAAVVRDHAAAGRAHDLVLLGNDAPDTGDFQVPVRLAHELDRPVVTGAKVVEVAEEEVRIRGDAPDGGVERYRLPLPAVVALMEGGVEPRYPTVKGRMGARKVEVEVRAPVAEPQGAHRVRLVLPPPQPSSVQVLGDGPEAAPAVVDLLESLGVTR